MTKKTGNDQAQTLADLDQELKAALTERGEAYEKLKEALAVYRGRQTNMVNHDSGRQVLGFKPEDLETAKREHEAAQAEHDRVSDRANRIANQIDEIREKTPGK